jgi:hypothetical protein
VPKDLLSERSRVNRHLVRSLTFSQPGLEVLQNVIEQSVHEVEVMMQNAGLSLLDHPDCKAIQDLLELPEIDDRAIRDGTDSKLYSEVREILVSQLTLRVADERNQIHRMLLAKVPHVHTEFGRFLSESEFRLSIVPPLTFLSVLTSMEQSQLWIFALALPLLVFLWAEALGRMRDAGDLLADVLLLGLVQIPTLKQFSRTAKMELTRTPSGDPSKPQHRGRHREH